MLPIHSLVSDLELEIELLSDLKNRSIEQKQFYIDQGASAYYSAAGKRKHSYSNNLAPDDYAQFIISHGIDASKSHAIVSLGCGNSAKEKVLLQRVAEQNIDAIYIGVDCSKTMLELTKNELNTIALQQRYLCADFASPFFRTELSTYLGRYTNKIFAFLGGTIGNIKPSNIVDTLHNMLTPQDFLWLDVYIRPNTGPEGDIMLFKKYMDHLESFADFRYSLLEKVNIKREHGEFTLTMDREDATGSLVFQFGFSFKDKVKLRFRNETLTFLPGETISLGNARNYDIDLLNKFFWEHDFDLITSEQKGATAQLLFKKRQ